MSLNRLNRLNRVSSFLWGLAIVLVLPAATGWTQGLKTENVVLITADGLRHEELFSGVDPLMLENPKQAGIKSPERLKEAYWRTSAAERRQALLPFLQRWPAESNPSPLGLDSSDFQGTGDRNGFLSPFLSARDPWYHKVLHPCRFRVKIP